ncbi:hypothetical protein NKH77_43805 [Streptomyces sp. M19]
MDESDEVPVAESDDETLAELADAVGSPPPSVLENAKALFAAFGEGAEGRAREAEVERVAR